MREVLAYDRAFEEVIKFIDNSEIETVAISTSDHETGGLVVARQVSELYPDYLWYPEVLLNSTHSGDYLSHKVVHYKEKDNTKKFTNFIKHEILEKDLGISDYTAKDVDLIIEKANNAGELLYVLNNIVSIRAQIGWTTHGHSAVDVNIYAHTNSPAIKSKLLSHKAYDGLSGNHENIEIGAFIEYITGSDLNQVTQLIKKTEHSPDNNKAKVDDIFHANVL